MIGSMPKVLIVEDDAVIADGMARHLRAAAFDPVWVGNGRAARSPVFATRAPTSACST
jgi:DNA-binding response OmpR family regulator